MRKSRWLLIGLSALLLSSSLTACGKYTVKIDKVEEEETKEVEKKNKKRIVDEEYVDAKEVKETQKEGETKGSSFGNLGEDEIVKETEEETRGKSIISGQSKQYAGMRLSVPDKYDYAMGEIAEDDYGHTAFNVFTYTEEEPSADMLILMSVPTADTLNELDLDMDDIDVTNPDVLTELYEEYLSNYGGLDDIGDVASHVKVERYSGIDWGILELNNIEVDNIDAKFDMIMAFSTDEDNICLCMWTSTIPEDKHDFYDVLDTIELNDKESEVDALYSADDYVEDTTSETEESTEVTRETERETERETTTSSNKVNIGEVGFTVNGVKLVVDNSMLEDVYEAVNGEEPYKVDNYGSDRYYIEFKKDKSNYLQVVTDGKGSDSIVKAMTIYYPDWEDGVDYEVSEFRKGVTLNQVKQVYGEPDRDGDSWYTWSFNDGDLEMTVYEKEDTHLVWQVELESQIYD